MFKDLLLVSIGILLGVYLSFFVPEYHLVHFTQDDAYISAQSFSKDECIEKLNENYQAGPQPARAICARF